MALSSGARSQEQAGTGWQAGIEAPAAAAPNTTVIPRHSPDQDGGAAGEIKLIALLTADGQQIDQGLVWRIYENKLEAEGANKLIATHRDASPSVRLDPGEYLINVSFGRANLTRKVTVKEGAGGTEPFVLNAGGLRLIARIGEEEPPPNAVTYAIFSDERDQFDNRTAVMTGAKPGLIIRLNAGIYRIVSTYGDCNATVTADLTVEAGKLTEAVVSHAAAKATFKLVTRTGGEAQPDTQWSIQTPEGTLIKQSVGALPTHVLAPGNYVVLARSAGRMYRREFAVGNGDIVQVEVMMR